MQSAFCADCHPAIYAEHRANTHGRAFSDEETRLATRDFRREDCIRCHTPRPIFETGIGMTPMQRWTDLDEGNTCMSCHWKENYDYARFVGGAECKTAFDPRVGTVQACASCHRIAGTPDQWTRAEHGEKAGNLCVDCHMPLVDRPVAVGEAPRSVRSHVFPASRSESQLRRAYSYSAKIEGNEVVVAITNRGAGHNFPTATRQRSLESLIIVRDADGREVGRSRMVCHYPYASELAPGQLTLPISTQIPSGKTREHRAPITVERGSIECDLFFKLYRPSDDFDEKLSRRLETRQLLFADIQPSTASIVDPPEIGFPAPPAELHQFFSPDGLVNVARPAPTAGPIEIPEGKNAEEIARLVSLLEFHMPEARRLARERLTSLGEKAWPALIEALGSWSNETFNQAIELLASCGERALPVLRDALSNPNLYIRCHARFALAKIEIAGDRRAVLDDLAKGLCMPHPLDRRSSAEALGELGDAAIASELRPLLADSDWDVVSAAARSLARLGDSESVAPIRRALDRASFMETKRDLAIALCELGSADGVPVLLDGLDEPDELVRSTFFEPFFAATGLHACYDPRAPRPERLESIARLRAQWATKGEVHDLRARPRPAKSNADRAWQLVELLGGGTDVSPGGDDAASMDELVKLGADAVPALVEGLTFPSGYREKRERVCEALGRIGDPRAAPFLASALRDPYLSVSEWACWALEGARDPSVRPALSRYESRALALEADPNQHASAERMLARVARTRWMLGDETARTSLVDSLSSDELAAREIAIGALEERYGERRGYDPKASADERRAAVLRWSN